MKQIVRLTVLLLAAGCGVDDATQRACADHLEIRVVSFAHPVPVSGSTITLGLGQEVTLEARLVADERSGCERANLRLQWMQIPAGILQMVEQADGTMTIGSPGPGNTSVDVWLLQYPEVRGAVEVRVMGPA